MNRLIVSLSPHVHSGDSVQKNMYGVCIALVPALIASLYFFGLGAAVVMLTSVVSCVLFEWAVTRFILRREKVTVLDGSAILTGILLGFNLPSTLPVWIIIIGAMVAICIGKMTFGGLGQNPFNPALVGRVFLLISFPAQMTTWPKSGTVEYVLSDVDSQTCATPLSIMQHAIGEGRPEILSELPDSLDMLIGRTGGSLGEVSAILLLLGCAYMLARKIITWHIPVSILGTVAVLSAILHVTNPVYASPVVVLCSGGLMLGACFMATDYVTSPMVPKGQLIYGISIGVLTVVIRNWGSYPEGMSFAILIMNAFTPLINTYCKPKRFGEKPGKEAAK